MEDSSLSEYEARFFELEMKDWPAKLGYDPARFGVNVGMGMVDGERIGLLSALMVANIRHELWQSRQSRRAELGLPPDNICR